VCTVQDITERQQLLQDLAVKNTELHSMPQQLWQTAKLATMGELATSIAHELNNLLGIVSLRVESLLAQIPVDDGKHRALEIIAQEIERMGSLVADLLQFSRNPTHQVSTLDVREEGEYGVECAFEPVNVVTARWLSSTDPRKLDELRKKSADNLALDAGENLAYLAPTRVNLELTQERWPDIRFSPTREH
jgi:signal transduction histidine kinase